MGFLITSNRLPQPGFCNRAVGLRVIRERIKKKSLEFTTGLTYKVAVAVKVRWEIAVGNFGLVR
ncbi:MAG: hypothetical protein HYX72_04525 [Acidobacteria bacterium]|nr:hypothetical protein [Acidobacteriota bacterium]